MKQIIVTAGRHTQIERGERFNDGSIQVRASGEEITVSDGYHTMDELYDHRIMLFIALCKKIGGAWRSRLHSDGSSFDGWFIMGLGKEAGEQITYHLPSDRWDECDFAEILDRAPEFDGHKPSDVLERLHKI